MLYQISTNIRKPYYEVEEFIGELMSLINETQEGYRPAWVMQPSVDQTEGQTWLITMFNIDKPTIDLLNFESDFIIETQD